MIPRLGELVANDRSAYQYLVESIRKFPAQVDFENMIRDAGFSEVRHENMAMGVCAVHSGFKLVGAPTVAAPPVAAPLA